MQDLGRVLSNADHAETVSWLAGVPLLVLFCLFLAGVSGIYGVSLVVVTVIGALMTLYLMDVDQQLAHIGEYRATCDLLARQQNSKNPIHSDFI